ncbi:GDSL-type esterase/lipase family protein [Maribacter sp. 2307ULW6-5]
MSTKRPIPLPYALLGLWLLLYGTEPIWGQERPFAQEVALLVKKYGKAQPTDRDTYVFTGSSSIRLWPDLEAAFPDKHIINTGFGGSQATDLDHYLEPLVLAHRPKKVFIYEGDNDLAAKKRPREVLGTTRGIVKRIAAAGTTVQVYLIAAKPSISRWKWRCKYKRFNRSLKRWGQKDPFVTFVDIWTPMLHGRRLKKDIFVSDGLHMNPKGYALWYDAIKEHVNAK